MSEISGQLARIPYDKEQRLRAEVERFKSLLSKLSTNGIVRRIEEDGPTDFYVDQNFSG